MAEDSGRTLRLVPMSAALGLEQRDDDELVLLARAGQTAAFDTLVRRHQTALVRMARRMLGSPFVAKDAVQNTFLEIHRYLPSYQPRGRFRSFAFRVAYRQCLMLKRQASRARVVEPQTAAQALPDDALLAREKRRLVERALLAVNVKLRVVVVLKWVNDFALEEIADVLEIPVGTVKSRLFEGMKQLRANLEGER